MEPHLRYRSQEHPLNADPADQLVLLDLAAQDTTIAQLTHQRSSLREIERLAALHVKIGELDAQRIEASTLVQDLEREQKRAEGDVGLVRTRKVRDEERLASGAIRNPKDLESLQHELQALDRRIGTLEDAELEVMEKLEDAQDRLQVVTAELDGLQVDVDTTKMARDEAFAAIDADLAVARSEREGLAQRVPDALEALYEKIRTQRGGLGAARLRARHCEGCRLELNGADLREIKALPDDEVVRCPECSRILVRTEESGL